MLSGNPGNNKNNNIITIIIIEDGLVWVWVVCMALVANDLLA